MKNIVFSKNINREQYVIASYYVESKTSLYDAAWAIALGQSVGNPNVRNNWETEELFKSHSCKILNDPTELKQVACGEVEIAFPTINFDWLEDGVSHLMVNLMGGQLDIDIIKKCHLNDIEFPQSISSIFPHPKYGIEGIRAYTKVTKSPILGAILKPKTGISPEIMLEMVKELVEGGVNFIKEDEILSNPSFCRIEDRVPLIMKYLKGKNVIYCVSIHSDTPHLVDRVKLVHSLGGNGVHVNFWCGLGIYKTIRELDLPLFIHYQKSGDKILTNESHDYHVKWPVLCKLAGMCGVDFIHAGMIGGYYKWPEKEVMNAISISRRFNVMPALSCGFHPGLTQTVTDKIGPDYMANVGGAIHGHPNGTTAGALAMRQSINGEYGPEYDVAIKKWGQ